MLWWKKMTKIRATKTIKSNRQNSMSTVLLPRSCTWRRSSTIFRNIKKNAFTSASKCWPLFLFKFIFMTIVKSSKPIFPTSSRDALKWVSRSSLLPTQPLIVSKDYSKPVELSLKSTWLMSFPKWKDSFGFLAKAINLTSCNPPKKYTFL